jgi:carbon monoxide dehydrogenase subunit G
MGNCYNKIEINTPISKVWETIKDFHDMSWAPGVITSLTKVGDRGGSEVGAKRVLNDAFHETLINVDQDNYTFSYSIDDGPGPVAKSAVENYIGVVKLTEIEGRTLVEWSSSYQSENDDEVADLCNPIYVALLSELNKTLS